MTAKPAVPPKPKVLSGKEQLVAFPSGKSDVPAVISSPFDTSAQLEPKFFYGTASSSSGAFKSYYTETKVPKKSGGPGKGRRPSLPNGAVNSISPKNATTTPSRLKVKTRETFSSFYDPPAMPTRSVESAEVGLACGSAFAEAKRKFGQPTGHASKDSPYLPVHAANVSPEHDQQKIPTEKTSYAVIPSSCQLESATDGQTGEEDFLQTNQTINQREIAESYSKDKEFFMATVQDDLPQSRNSLVSNGTTSSMDSEKSIAFKIDGQENLPGIPTAHRVAAEIVETEFQYLQSLKLLLIDLPAAVQGSLPPEELTLMLQGLPQIEKLCEDLYGDLQIHLRDYSTDKLIAPVFLKKGKVLLLYVSYVNDFEKLIDTYRHLLRKYPNFADMVAKFELSPICKKIPLVEYFHKPIQRLPRYPLLLGTYLRALEEEHPDRENTKRALDLVSDVTAQANTTLASVEKVHKLLWYQARTVGYTFLQSNRTFIREGVLKKLSRKAPQDRTMLLCSDVLICGEFDSITGMKFTVNQEYFLDKIKVEHSIDPDYFDRDVEFGIYSGTKSVVFQAQSIEERNAWLSAISRATEDVLKNLNKRKIALRLKSVEELNFAPIWIPDYRVMACQLCKKQFSLFRRYHHCRLCGYAVCASCSPHEVGIDYKDNRNKRVCVTCFDDAKKNPS